MNGYRIMENYRSYKELDVWQKSRSLVKAIYRLTEEFPKNEYYGLASQLQRSAVSIPANIAEGYGRQYKKETIQFLYIARGSLFELETEVYLSFDLKFIKEGLLNELLLHIESCRKLLSGLIRYFEKNKDLY